MLSNLLLSCALGACPPSLFSAAPFLHAQGGEPQYFAIRGAKVVPVSGPPVENATIIISRGLIAAIGKDLAIPPEAWVIDGKGLTVYPGLFDSFTDVGIPAAPPASSEGGPRRSSEGARGPEDRPYSSPWPTPADELTLTDTPTATWPTGPIPTVPTPP